MLIIVPAYNEQKKIGRVVRGLFEHGFNRVLIVDDGSTDDTAESARAAGALVSCHPINRGQGAALETGHEYARANGEDAVVHFDGDDQLNPADIALAMAAFKTSGADVLLGSRFLDNRSRLPWLKKFVVLPVARVMNYLFTGVKLTDAHNGFRILNQCALEKIRLRQDGMAHATEIVGQIKKFNLKFVEFPVEVRYYEFGQGVRGGVRILVDLIKAMMLR